MSSIQKTMIAGLGKRLLLHSFYALLALGLMLCAGSAQATGAAGSHTDFDHAFERTFERYQLPGLAVGVIEDGEVVYMRTAGELQAGQGEPVDADSLFKIASTTKAMTTAVLARLVDEGKLRWDDPVTKYLPTFRMHDPWVTRNMQVRDLLIHNSGLRPFAGDLMLWPEPNRFQREDIIAGLAHLKPTHGFRAGYTYDNLLYVVAGVVAERAGGMPYAELIKAHVFLPLGMDRCQVGAWSRDAVGNLAQPHVRENDANVVVRPDLPSIPDTPLMAAGGIRCSLKDMLTWMRAWLVPEAHPFWLSAAQRREVWTLQQPMPISQSMREWDNTRLSGYGYGWRLTDVDGQWKVAHTGTLLGMVTSLVLLPDQRNGFILMINCECDDARTVLTQALVKHYTAPGKGFDVDYYAALLEKAKPKAEDESPVKLSSEGAAATPAELTRWLGVYRDPWFGEIRFCPAEKGILFESSMSPKLKGPVSRMQERWKVEWTAADAGPVPWLDFEEESGQAARMTLSYANDDGSPGTDYADLDLRRVRGCE